jgi:hypothetical protein
MSANVTNLLSGIGACIVGVAMLGLDHPRFGNLGTRIEEHAFSETLDRPATPPPHLVRP